MRSGIFQHDGIFWRRFGAIGAIHLPWAVKIWLVPLVAWLYLLLVPAARRRIAANLEAVLGPCRRLESLRRAGRSMTEFAHVFAETFEVQSRATSGADSAESIEIERTGLPDEALAGTGHGGLIVLTSHFGCWEIGARMLARRGRPVNVVMARETNPSVRAYLAKMRAGQGIHVLHSDTSRFASVMMLQALRRGEILAIQMDRVAPGQVTREIHLFGRAALFPIGAFALARAAGVPIWPVLSVRVGRRRYRFLHEPLIEIPRGASDEVLVAALQQVVTRLEARIRQFPYQWFQYAPIFADDGTGSDRARTSGTG